MGCLAISQILYKEYFHSNKGALTMPPRFVPEKVKSGNCPSMMMPPCMPKPFCSSSSLRPPKSPYFWVSNPLVPTPSRQNASSNDNGRDTSMITRWKFWGWSRVEAEHTIKLNWETLWEPDQQWESSAWMMRKSTQELLKWRGKSLRRASFPVGCKLQSKPRSNIPIFYQHQGIPLNMRQTSKEEGWQIRTE